MATRVTYFDLGPAAGSVPQIDASSEGAVLPEQCPTCDSDQQYLQHISVKRRTKTQRCFECGTVWESAL
jgi:hypothetical protein